jgi:Flp pilus assembly protein TadD
MHVTWSSPPIPPKRHRRHFRAAPFAVLGLAATMLAGCQSASVLSSLNQTGSGSAPAAAKADIDWRHEAETLGAKYRAEPGDPDVALAYAQALRAGGQRAQAVSVLEQASLRQPRNTVLLGAYGKALADVGNLDQALEVLNRAHSPDQPDWRILSAQGAVLDQLGRHKEAQGYYASALKIKPEEPSVLSNLGLSYALSKDLKQAEATLRRASTPAGADPRVRQNLALVVGLQGRFSEAESIARADLPSDQAAANVAYLRQMLAQQDDLKTIGRPNAARRT